jgi:hypothetical protein
MKLESELTTTLTNSDLNYNRRLLVGTCVACVFYGMLELASPNQIPHSKTGILSLLYYQCARLSLLGKRDLQSWIALVYTTSTFVTSTIGIGSYIKLLEKVLIDDQGIFQKRAVLPFLPPYASTIVGLASFMVIIWLQDGLLVRTF